MDNATLKKKIREIQVKRRQNTDISKVIENQTNVEVKYRPETREALAHQRKVFEFLR